MKKYISNYSKTLKYFERISFKRETKNYYWSRIVLFLYRKCDLMYYEYSFNGLNKLFNLLLYQRVK